MVEEEEEEDEDVVKVDDRDSNDTDEDSFFSTKKRDKIRDSKFQKDSWNFANHMFLLLSRTVHITFAMLTCSLVLLNLVFDNF